VINASRRLGLLVGSTLALSVPALAADSIQIKELVIAGQIPAAQRAATLKAVRAFYEFWNTGDVPKRRRGIPVSIPRRDVRYVCNLWSRDGFRSLNRELNMKVI